MEARFQIGTQASKGSQAASENGFVPAPLLLMYLADHTARYHLSLAPFRGVGRPRILE